MFGKYDIHKINDRARIIKEAATSEFGNKVVWSLCVKQAWAEAKGGERIEKIWHRRKVIFIAIDYRPALEARKLILEELKVSSIRYNAERLGRATDSLKRKEVTWMGYQVNEVTGQEFRHFHVESQSKHIDPDAPNHYDVRLYDDHATCNCHDHGRKSNELGNYPFMLAECGCECKHTLAARWAWGRYLEVNREIGACWTWDDVQAAGYRDPHEAADEARKTQAIKTEAIQQALKETESIWEQSFHTLDDIRAHMDRVFGDDNYCLHEWTDTQGVTGDYIMYRHSSDSEFDEKRAYQLLHHTTNPNLFQLVDSVYRDDVGRYERVIVEITDETWKSTEQTMSESQEAHKAYLKKNGFGYCEDGKWFEGNGHPSKRSQK